MSQIQEMIKPAAAMLDTYPVVTTKQKIKQWIKTCVPGMTPEKVERYSWPQALLAMGLLQAYEQTKDKTALSSVFSYLRRWKNSGYPISHVDHVMNGSVALWTEEIFDEGKKGRCRISGSALDLRGKGRTFAQAGSKQRKKLRTASLRTRSQHPDWLFADTLGMLCPFACRYGVQKQDKELLNLGIRQLELFFQKGMDEKTGLPYHGYDEKTGMKLRNNRLGKSLRLDAAWIVAEHFVDFRAACRSRTDEQAAGRAVSSLSVLPVCCPGGLQSSAFTAAAAP